MRYKLHYFLAAAALLLSSVTASAASFILRAPSPGLQPTPAPVTTPTDPDYSYVTLLMHLDGNYSNAQNVTFTPGNGTAMSTTNKFGSGSVYFNGGGNGLRTSSTFAGAEFGSSPFTAEAWVNFATQASTQGVMGNYSWSTNQGWRLVCGFNSSGVFSCDARLNGIDIGSNGVNITTGSWHHLALTGNGTTANIYLDGNLIGTGSYSGTGSSGNTFAIGVNPDTSSGVTWPMSGYVDDVRITKGVQRYTGNTYTVPAAVFPDQ